MANDNQPPSNEETTPEDKARKKEKVRRKFIQEMYVTEDMFCNTMAIFADQLNSFLDKTRNSLSTHEIKSIEFIISIYQNLAKPVFPSFDPSSTTENNIDALTALCTQNSYTKLMIDRFAMSNLLYKDFENLITEINKKIKDEQAKLVGIEIPYKDATGETFDIRMRKIDFKSIFIKVVQVLPKFPLMWRELEKQESNQNAATNTRLSLINAAKANTEHSISYLNKLCIIKDEFETYLTEKNNPDKNAQENSKKFEISFEINVLASKLAYLNIDPLSTVLPITSLLHHANNKTLFSRLTHDENERFISDMIFALTKKDDPKDMIIYLYEQLSKNPSTTLTTILNQLITIIQHPRPSNITSENEFEAYSNYLSAISKFKAKEFINQELDIIEKRLNSDNHTYLELQMLLNSTHTKPIIENSESLKTRITKLKEKSVAILVDQELSALENDTKNNRNIDISRVKLQILTSSPDTKACIEDKENPALKQRVNTLNDELKTKSRPTTAPPPASGQPQTVAEMQRKVVELIYQILENLNNPEKLRQFFEAQNVEENAENNDAENRPTNTSGPSHH